MAFDIENFPTSEMAKKSLGLVTKDFYDRSYVGKWLYQVMGLEMDEMQAFIDTMREQSFPETATWGLKYHEIKWGLPVRENLSYEERRKLICEKRDYIAPMTPYKMESFLRDVTGMEVLVADIHDPTRFHYVPDHPNRFKVFFIGDQTLDVNKALKRIRLLKQSHTTFEMADRREIIIDESGLEQVILRHILFSLKMQFWVMRTFDGSWLFDGEYLMDAGRRYGMRIGIKRRIAVLEEHEDVELSRIRFNALVEEEESQDASMAFVFGISFAPIEQNTSLGLLTKQETHETFDNYKLEKHSHNYWLWNGNVNMDGSRHFDSIYREEELV